jgi:hypothetical protein
VGDLGLATVRTNEEEILSFCASHTQFCHHQLFINTCFYDASLELLMLMVDEFLLLETRHGYL